MTDKEQIIIDTNKYFVEVVDEGGGTVGYTVVQPEKLLREIIKQNKQLTNKMQECEELFAKTYQMWMYYIANGINNASDLNIQYLLEDLGKITKMLAELCNIKDSTLSYYAGQAQDETNRYLKALEEIGKIVKINCEEICGRKFEDCNDFLCSSKNILDIINKAKDGNNE